MAALFRKKKNTLDVNPHPKKGRSQSLDPTSLAYVNLKQVSGAQQAKGMTLERLPVPTPDGSGSGNGSKSPNRGLSPSRRATEFFEGGLRQFQQLYKRRGSRDPDSEEIAGSLPNPGGLMVPGQGRPGRQRSGSVDVGRLELRRGSTEGSRSLPQQGRRGSIDPSQGRRGSVDPGQGRRGSVDPGLRIYSALRSNGVRRNSVDANVKQFHAIYQQRKSLKSEQAALFGGSGQTSPVPTSIPESPEITSRYHQPRPGSEAAKAVAAADAQAETESKSHSTISSASYNANLYRRYDDPTRRRSLSGGDAISDHNRMAILFRDSRGLPAVDPFMDTLHSTDLKEDESQIYIKFFKFHKCYDLIPTSAKLVVFDTQLLVKKAFFALVYNGVRAAPLWDSKKQQYVGMLTITDFIRILQMYYKNSDERIEELEEHKLETWRTVLESDSKPLIYIGPEASLHAAIVTLLKNRIHRLPVIDPVSGDVLYIITHKRILRFLCLYVSTLPRPSFVNRTLGELRIGTYDTIETARPETPVIEALTKFVNRRVSALPIVDADNKLTHIYAKFDVINLAAEKTYNNLNVPLMAANSHRSNTTVEACRLSDTLAQVMDKIVAAEVHRLVITDDEQHVIGIISLSDILDALVLRPHEYNTGLHDSGSGGDLGGDTELLGEDESHTIVEEEPGDEEEPLAAASAGVGGLSLGKNG